MELTEAQARQRLAVAVDKAGSQMAFALKVYCTEPYLSNVIKGKRPLGPKILKELRLEVVTVTTYREKE